MSIELAAFTEGRTRPGGVRVEDLQEARERQRELTSVDARRHFDSRSRDLANGSDQRHNNEQGKRCNHDEIEHTLQRDHTIRRASLLPYQLLRNAQPGNAALAPPLSCQIPAKTLPPHARRKPLA